MKLLFTSLLLFLTTAVFAQQAIFYLKKDGKYINQSDSADYIRVIKPPDSASVLYNVFEFYKNGTPKLIGKSRTIDPPWYEGQCLNYYESGKKQSLGNYKNNLKSGDFFEYYSNGKLYQALKYPDTTRVDNIKDDFLIIANYDSLGTVQVQNGEGYYKGFDEKFNYISDAGKIVNGKREGTWKIDFRNRNITATEVYKNGELISGESETGNGDVTKYSGSRFTSPEFKGGVEAFGSYLGNNIKYPENERRRNIEGRVIITFVIEKDGSLSSLKVLRSVSPGLDDEALRVLKRSPKWVPGTMMGKPMRVNYSVPVNFALR
ncbi:energy transducer TonB [Mucilaginibacter sp.]|uniref:energy transducer TonB n=1 Tax=Mucilaginibacter sp. TaxID=1882438 RepID=UPI00261E6C42|nr:energy transducer TonB [Mucilaginibacter sp.]MDB5126925.1 TonB family C-terminal protein [Mucilaginibacter sp.]